MTGKPESTGNFIEKKLEKCSKCSFDLEIIFANGKKSEIENGKSGDKKNYIDKMVTLADCDIFEDIIGTSTLL